MELTSLISKQLAPKYDMLDFAFLGVPINFGRGHAGVEDAPDSLRELLDLDSLNVFDAGNLEINPVHDELADSRVLFLSSVVSTSRSLADKVEKLVLSGYIPITVGGDHSLTLGSVAGVSRIKEKLGVIYIDAHGDFNTEATTPSGNAHGMPCAVLMGWCESELRAIPHRYIDPDNFSWLGVRDLDPGERYLAEKYNLNLYSPTKINTLSIDQVMKSILDKFSERGIENIHCSIDVDCLDPTIFSATGLNVPNGLSREVFERLLYLICTTGKVCSFDLVEYNPRLDNDARGGKLCLEIIKQIIGNCRNGKA